MCILLLTFYNEWVIRCQDFIGLQRTKNHQSPSLSKMGLQGWILLTTSECPQSANKIDVEM
jgi:hypothetical protein